LTDRQIALHFVQDKTTRFDLAIECGNLEVALETAKDIDHEDSWVRLAQQALKQGNHKVRRLRNLEIHANMPNKIVEVCYQRTKNFERLSFLYLITGNPEKLSKMAKIAEMRNDHMSRFHNAIFMGDAAGRVAVLRDVGLRMSHGAYIGPADVRRSSAGLPDCEDEWTGRSGSRDPGLGWHD
jgi:coatomer protein complex subunit alpha (xenin)